MGILRQLFGHELEDIQDQDLAREFTYKLLHMLNCKGYSKECWVKHLNRLFDEASYRDDVVYLYSCVLTGLIYEMPELEERLFQ